MSTHLSSAVLSGHLDGETTAAEAWAVTEHLRDCAACRARQSMLAEARDALRRLPRRAASPVALQGRLRVSLAASRAGAEQERRSAWSWLCPPAMAGAGTWFLAVLLLVLYSAPVRGFEDGGAARRRVEAWQKLESYEALLALEPAVSDSARSRRP